MDIEYEATFFPVVKESVREILRKNGAKLINSEYLQKRTAFNLPKGHEIAGGWARVRQEADKITMSVKIVEGHGIENKRDYEKRNPMYKFVPGIAMPAGIPWQTLCQPIMEIFH